MGKRKGLTRRQLLQGFGAVGGGSAVYRAMAGLGMTTSLETQPLDIRPGVGADKHVVILGAGVAGLATAYELLKAKSGYTYTILEANAKVGGRSLTLRPGDKLVEELESGSSTATTGSAAPSRSARFCRQKPRGGTGPTSTPDRDASLRRTPTSSTTAGTSVCRSRSTSWRAAPTSCAARRAGTA
jgi:putative NAD(P)-binding protein